MTGIVHHATSHTKNEIISIAQWRANQRNAADWIGKNTVDGLWLFLLRKANPRKE